jgi:hypothetical protein
LAGFSFRVAAASRQPRDFIFRVEMLGSPAEIAPRLRAAQLLVERIAPRLFPGLGRYRVSGKNF